MAMQTEQTNERFMQELTDVQQDLLHFVQASLFAYPDDVMDVVQETNYALISHVADYKTGGAVPALGHWLCEEQDCLFPAKEGTRKACFR